MSLPNAEGLWSTTKLGEYYGVHRETIRAWCADGKIPGAKKVGGRWKAPAPTGSQIISGFTDQRDQEPETSVQWFDDRWYKVPTETGAIDFYPSATTILGIINNKWLSRWRGDVGNAVADKRMMEAADKGSRIHRACAIYAEKGAVLLDSRRHSRFGPEELRKIYDKHEGNVAILYDQDEQLQVYRFSQWLNAVQPEILGTEITVFSHEHQIAGTLDYLLRIKGGAYPVNGSRDLLIPGGVYVMDLKTGKIQDEDKYPMQVSAYVECAEEPSINNSIRDIKVDGGLIVYTNAPVRKANPDEDEITGMKTYLMSRAESAGHFKDFMHARALWWRTNQHTVPKIFDLPTILSAKTD